MAPPSKVVLILDTDEATRELYRRELARRFRVLTCSTEHEAWAALAGQGVDALVLELTALDDDDLELCGPPACYGTGAPAGNRGLQHAGCPAPRRRIGRSSLFDQTGGAARADVGSRRSLAEYDHRRRSVTKSLKL